jgi:hypothetical protein
LLGGEPPELVAFSHSTTISPKQFDRTLKWTRFHELFPTKNPESLWVGARKGDRYYKWRSHADRSWTAEVFDLAEDPNELVNLYDPEDPEHVAMVNDLKTYKEQLINGFYHREGPADAEDALRDMGYIGDDEDEEDEE